MSNQQAQSEQEIEETIRLADASFAVDGMYASEDVKDKVRRALRGEITFDEVAKWIASKQ